MPRLLLVEDDPMNRDMLSRRLLRRKFEVLLAEDGEAAVEMARNESPELILMDISLPKMDGLEATRILKDSPDTASVPIIALTAHAMASDRERALEAGCDDYDTKPIELSQLLEKIDALLGNST